MGYCCPFAFFSIFRRTDLIAARLGVHPATVRRAKAKVDDKEWKCEGCPRCMKQHIQTVERIGKKTLGLR